MLRHPAITLLVLLATIGAECLSVHSHVPKGFFPQQDSGRLTGSIQADQDTSFQAMQEIVAAVGEDRAGTIRRSTASTATPAAEVSAARPRTRRACSSALKPLEERRVAADYIMRAAAAEAGARAGRDALSAGLAGSARRRTLEQRALSVHDARRQSAGPDHTSVRGCCGRCADSR